MPWVAAVGSLVGGYISSQGAQGAAGTQAGAGYAAIASQERMLAEQRKLLEPYTTGGLGALDRLIKGTAAGGEFTTPFKMSESQAQQFATKEALAAMQSQMATGGQALSSNAITGAGQLAGDIASKYEQQAFNQWLAGRQQDIAPLQFLANLGQASAAGSAANIGAAGSNISSLQTGIGNVQAAGQMAQASAIGQGIGNVSQYMMLQSLLNKQPSTTQTTTTQSGNAWDTNWNPNYSLSGQ